jgi:hypothetical protein
MSLIPRSSTSNLLGRTLRWSGSAVLLVLAGCTSGPQLERALVKGKVTLDGAVLSGVIVTFYPVTEGIEGLPFARGTSDANGVYELADADGKPGAVVSKSRVVVRWPRERGAGDRLADDKLTIPLRYTVANDTPLFVEVQPGGPQVIDLALKK